MRHATRIAAFALAAILWASFQPALAAPRADAPELYVLYDGTYYELVDRAGQTPPIADRKLGYIATLYSTREDGTREVLAYWLREASYFPLEEGLDDKEIYNRHGPASALIGPDGSVLRDYAKNREYVQYHAVGEYIQQNIERESQDGYTWETRYIDPATGKDIDLLPGRTGLYLVECGEGYLATVDALDAPPPQSEEDDKGYRAWCEVFYLDASLQPVFSAPCSYAREARWQGEVFIILDRWDGNLSTSSLLSLEGKILLDDFTSISVASIEKDQDTLCAYIGDKRFTVDKETLAIKLVPDDNPNYIGGLACTERIQWKGSVGTTYTRVVDADGKEILPEIKGYYRFTERSPILAEEAITKNQNRFAVFSRTGEIISDWQESKGWSGILQERDVVYIAEGNEVALYLPESQKTLRLPEGTVFQYFYTVGGKTVAEYLTDNPEEHRWQYRWFVSFVSEDMELIGPLYSEIQLLDYNDDGNRTMIVGKAVRGNVYKGLIGEDGNEILPCRYESIAMEGDLLAVRMGSWYGLIDYEGNWVVRRSRLRNLGE